MVPRDQYERASTVARPRRSRRSPRHLDRARAHDRAALAVAAEVERAREAAEQPDAQRRVGVAERRGRLLEQLHRTLVGEPGAPARVLVADRGAREQLRVAQLAGDLRGVVEGRQRVGRLAAAVARGAELEEHLRALARVLDLQLERRAQPRRRLVERERGGGRAPRADVVVDRALHAAERSGRGEVVREVGERAGRALVVALERLADGEVQLRAAQAGEPVVERAAHELVREPVGQLRLGRDLLDHPAARGLLDRGVQLGLREAGGAADDVQLELGPGGGRELQQVDRPGRQAGEALGDDLAHALGGAELRQRAGQAQGSAVDLDDPGLDERAPQLADQERVPVGELADRVREVGRAGADLAARGAGDELGHLVVGEAAELEAHDVVGAAQVGERLGERLRHVGVGVAEGAEQQQARVGGGAHEMAQEQERRGVGPVPVLDHEQHRAPAADRGEQVGHGRVQPVALGVGIGLDGGRQLADRGREVGQQAGELAGGRAEGCAELVGVDYAREAVEGLDEGPVGRAHDRVAGAVEDERALARRRGGELADETALARAGLAADEHDAAALALGAWHQRLERLELGGAPDEGEGGGEGERAGEFVHGIVRSDYAGPCRAVKLGAEVGQARS